MSISLSLSSFFFNFKYSILNIATTTDSIITAKRGLVGRAIGVDEDEDEKTKYVPVHEQVVCTQLHSPSYSLYNFFITLHLQHIIFHILYSFSYFNAQYIIIFTRYHISLTICYSSK